MEYQHARRGSGTTVHAIGEGGQLCGAGTNTIGTRRTGRLRYTADAITCKTCLKKIEARARPLPMNGTDYHQCGEV